MKRTSTNNTRVTHTSDTSAPLSRFLQLDEPDGLDHAEAQWIFISSDDDEPVVEAAPDLSALKRIKDFLNAPQNDNDAVEQHAPFLGAQNAHVDYPYYDSEHDEFGADFTPFEPSCTPTLQPETHDSQEDYALELKADELPVLTVATPSIIEHEDSNNPYEILDVDVTEENQTELPSDADEAEPDVVQPPCALTTDPDAQILPEPNPKPEITQNVPTTSVEKHTAPSTPRTNKRERNAARLPIFARFLSILAQNDKEEPRDDDQDDLDKLRESNELSAAQATRLVDDSSQDDTITDANHESSVALALAPGYSPETPGCSLVAAFCDQDAKLNSSYTATASALD